MIGEIDAQSNQKLILKLKKGLTISTKREKLPKICQSCGLIQLLSSQQCTNCRRMANLLSMDDETEPRVRPFDVSTRLTPSNSSLDDFLRTGKFLDYLKALGRCLPMYLMSATVIKCQRDEALFSVVGSMTYSQLTRHLMALRIEHVQRWCRPILQHMMQHPKNMNIFNTPVDAIALEIPQYLEKIKRPMDLGTVRSKLQRGIYESVSSCVADIALVFKNALSFNASDHPIYQLAQILETDLQTEMKSLDDKCAREIERKSQHSCSLCLGSSCSLCGEKCLKFEPPVLVCHGPCGQRIKKNSVYYVSPDASMVWCQKCHMSQPGGSCVWTDQPARRNETSSSSIVTVAKRNVLKRRSDEEVAEPWVSCDSCGHWVHQICALYNDGFLDPTKEADTSGYQCPLCRIEFAASAATVCEQKVVGSKISTPSLSARSFTHDPVDIIRTRGHPLQSSSDYPLVTETSTISLMTNHSSSQSVVETRLADQEIYEALGKLDYTSESDVHSSHDCSTDEETTTEGYLQTRAASILPPQMTDAVDRVHSPSDDESMHTDVNCDHSLRPMMNDESDDIAVTDNLEIDHGYSSTANDSSMKVNPKRKLNLNLNENPLMQSVNSESFGTADKESSHSARTVEYLKKWSARELPSTKLGVFLETMVHERLREAGYADIADTVTIRLTSNSIQQLEVPEPIRLNMMNADGSFVPTVLPYRQKCILLFQKIDGVDVCLFSLYVQEFDHNTPAPNNGVVYVAYLDSVDYFRPLEARTLVYQEILVAYFKWAQMRGFRQGHLWACPPQRGDNFIFWCHPAHQRTPSRDRLNAWYNSILLRTSKLGVLDSVTNIYNENFASYARREETSQRRAARNSFVGQGNAKANLHGNNKSVTSEQKDGNSSKHMEGRSSTPSELAEGVKLNGEEVPICPPIFEGDYWVSSCLRLHSQIQNRSNGCDGKNNAINHRRCRDIIKHLLSRQPAIPFSHPVDPVALGIPEYSSIVKQPMDLGTVRDKLRTFAYRNVLQMANDVRLTFDNAILFNPLGHPIYSSAKMLRAEFERSMVELLNDLIGVGGGIGLSPIDGQTSEGDRWLETLTLSEPPKEDSVSCTVVTHSSVRGKSAYQLGPPSTETIPTNSEPMSPSAWPLGRADSCDTFETSGTLIRVDSLNSSSSVWPSEENNPQDISDEFSRWAQRRTNAPLLVDIPPAQGFEQPQLGFRGAMSLMGDLSKAVLRLKDDLFVFKFADPSSTPATRQSAVIKAHRSAETFDTIDDCEEEEQEGRHDDDGRNEEEEGDEDEMEVEGLNSSDPMTADSSCSVSLSSAQPMRCNPQPAVRRRGRKKGSTNRATTYLRHSKLRETEREYIEESCLALLRDVLPDGSDPDSLFSSPLVDCRHTFLEMCQFRHFQFDTLRRAKHSSLMILHHLHSPENRRLRPTCTTCSSQLIDIRWHCELCANYDICESCYGSTSVTTHEHLLTPFRVTFV